MSEISAVTALLRSTLAEHEAELRLWDCAVPEGADPELIPPGIPAGVAELLRASNGLYLSHSTYLYRADQVLDRQFPEGLAEAPLPDGSPPDDPSRFFFFGEACLNPLLVDRDGTVWRVPDEGFVWFTGCRLEPIAESVDEFFRVWIASARFRDLDGVDPDDPTDSHWLQLLRLSGLSA
ncbi:hypothetical protein ABZW30_30650 [Kitasatospora sp. NPDC004669]|uniref:hypothetical protein n=1 Tax=Kitasatospora sp. NPDC004669 TaxID=3154555 RepID=UPI0033B3EFE2